MIIAISSYFILAVVFLIDKYLLAKAVPEPGAYAFYISILSLLILLLIPVFGIYLPSNQQIFFSFASGASFVLGTLWLFTGLKKFEASRIIPAIGGLVPIFTFLFVFIFSRGKETLSFSAGLAFILLVIGSILITLEKKISLKSFWLAGVAAFFFALSFVFSKYAFLGQGLWNALFWIKIGSGLTALFLFVLSGKIRNSVLRDSFRAKKGNVVIFFINQAGGAGANLLQNWAVAIAPLSFVAIINALQGTQYVFLLIITGLISLIFPLWSKEHGLKEKISGKIIIQKIISIILIIIGLIFLFMPNTNNSQKISWGVNFSQKHSQNFGLDWRANYLSLLDDMNVKKIKTAVDWDMTEPEKDKFVFDDTDWQLNEAQKRGAEIIPVIGMKTSRWPECHIPDWAKNLSKEEQQKEILAELAKIINRYSGENYKNTILAWQVENEPLFQFGECPWYDENFLKKEANLVRQLDPYKRPVIISDSGEWSSWFKTAKIADIVGITMYTRTWFKPLKIYIRYPFPPFFYRFKTWIIEKFFHKNVICIELQAEPWGRVLLYDLPLEEEKKTMSLEIFKENIEFAKKTGLNEFYLWGAEWWYWMKEKNNDPTYWNEAKKLF